MFTRLWHLSVRLHAAHSYPWTWNLRIALNDLAQWERGELTWKHMLFNLPTWFGIYEEDLR